MTYRYASLGDILRIKYHNHVDYYLYTDDVYEYSTNEWGMISGLVWISETKPKPTEEEIRAFAPEITYIINLDWVNLIQQLMVNPIFDKVYLAMETTTKANAAVSMLVDIVYYIRDYQLFDKYVLKLREVMSEIVGIGDFTEEELDILRDIFTANNFNTLVLEPLV